MTPLVTPLWHHYFEKYPKIQSKCLKTKGLGHPDPYHGDPPCIDRAHRTPYPGYTTPLHRLLEDREPLPHGCLRGRDGFARLLLVTVGHPKQWFCQKNDKIRHFRHFLKNSFQTPYWAKGTCRNGTTALCRKTTKNSDFRVFSLTESRGLWQPVLSTRPVVSSGGKISKKC